MTPEREQDKAETDCMPNRTTEEERKHAVVHLAALLKGNPDDVGAWFRIANLANSKSRKRIFLEKVIELDPGHEQARVELAKLSDAPAKESQEGTQLTEHDKSKTLDNAIIDYSASRSYKFIHTTMELHERLQLDRLAENWFGHLTFLERVVIESLYQLGYNALKSDDLERIVKTFSPGREVTKIRERAISKLAAIEARADIVVFERTLLDLIKHNPFAAIESQLDALLGSRFVIGTVPAAALARLILDVRDKSLQDAQRIQRWSPSAPEVPLMTKRKSADKKASIPLERLDLSRRTYNALVRAGINSVEELRELSKNQLLRIKNIGKVSASEIVVQLKKLQSEQTDPQINVNESQRLLNNEWLAPEIQDEINALPLEQIRAARLGLPEAVLHRLREEGISSLDDLVRHRGNSKLEELVIERMRYYLEWLVEADEKQVALEIAGQGLCLFSREQLQDITIEDVITSWLSCLPQRSQQIVQWRYGLNGKEWTLQEVGNKLGLSRERIRQLEKNSIRRLKQVRNLIKLEPFLDFLRVEISEHGGLVSESEYIEIFSNGRFPGRIGRIALIGVLKIACEVNVSLRYIANSKVAARDTYPLEHLRGLQRQIVKILSDKLAPSSSIEIIDDLKQSRFYRNRRDVLTDDFIAACLRTHPELEERGGDLYTLKKWRGKIGDEIVMAMRQLGEPRHYSEIATVVNKLLPSDEQTAERNVHAYLGRYPEVFIRVGHGIFGLAEWGLHDDGNLANAAYRVINEAGQPLHVDIITERVLETWHARPGSVYMAIQNDDRFTRVGSGVYYLRDLTQESKVLSETNFSDLYGDQLDRWQKEFDRLRSDIEDTTQDEVESIRNAGLDFFDT